jgi:hypothetical protein
VLNKEQRLVVTNDHVVTGTDSVVVYSPVKEDDTPITDPNWYERPGKFLHGHSRRFGTLFFTMAQATEPRS